MCLGHLFIAIPYFSLISFSDTMHNKGAFITLKGGTDLKPKFTTYDAVVSFSCLIFQIRILCKS